MKTMKHFSLILIALLAFAGSNGLLEAAPVPAAPDTLDHYIIDNQQVAQFDGSQLVGKKVERYRISTVVSDGKVVRIHDIQTEDAADASMRVVSVQAVDPAYVIDGKQVSKEEFERLKPSRIHSVMVVKSGSREDVKNYAGWENGVILVRTKKEGDPSVEAADNDHLKVITIGKTNDKK